MNTTCSPCVTFHKHQLAISPGTVTLREDLTVEIGRGLNRVLRENNCNSKGLQLFSAEFQEVFGRTTSDSLDASFLAQVYSCMKCNTEIENKSRSFNPFYDIKTLCFFELMLEKYELKGMSHSEKNLILGQIYKHTREIRNTIAQIEKLKLLENF